MLIIEGSRRFITYSIGSIALLVALLLTAPAFAVSDVPYAWTDADLALYYPAAWDAPTAAADEDGVSLTFDGGDTTLILTVLPASTLDDTFRPALETTLAALDLLPLSYDAAATMYGRHALHIDAVTRDRSRVGVARAGRLPDGRALLVVGGAPQTDADTFTQTLNTLLNSIAFSASAAPNPPTYGTVWRTAPGDQIVAGLAAYDGRLYVLDVENGIDVRDAVTGELVANHPFDNPAHPTAIAIDGVGIVYIGDTVCRCVRRMSATGEWLDPVGSFAGGAPFSLAVGADGTIYATDRIDVGYILRIIGAPRNRTVGLNFNASAPPLVTVGAGRIWVIEWLASLIDGSVSAAVSQVADGDKPAAEFRFWLESLSPEHVTSAATDPKGSLVLGTTDRGNLIINDSGDILDTFAENAAPRALAFAADGTLYVARGEGALAARSTRVPPDRVGGDKLIFGVPVQGTLDESAPQQVWTFDGVAGEMITVSAVDLARTNAYTVGIDMALRLFAPDGSELAYNDDQLGVDLSGVYDAQIPDFVLPQTGTYTVRVEWRQGGGTYTLGVSGDSLLELRADGVTTVEGYLQDVFPVQRWMFAGRVGDVLTFTMRRESGTLDPTLYLLNPDGSLLAYNDDAYDLQLDVNAQLAGVRLDADGLYVIEASRYDGAGRYSMVIVNTAR